MRLHLPLVLLLVLPNAAPAHAQDLPVVDPARETLTGPAWRADALEIRLAPHASRQAAIAVQSARLARRAGVVRTSLPALGVPAIDRVAFELGAATFEPEFHGEVPPAAGAGTDDLAAFFIVHLPPGVTLDGALARFRALPEVAHAGPIAILPVAYVPNDSLWAQSWWLFQPGRRDLHAPEAWDVTRGDTSVVIAVLDTGVLPWHPDLGGTAPGLRGQLFVNRAEAAGVAGVDDDGNGWIDDVSGWDFVDQPSGAGIPAGEDWDESDPDPNDYAGHGTLVAGIASARPDNGIGGAGAGWNTRIMPVRMAWATVANPGGLVDMSYAAQAIHYAWRNGAHVINASWASLLTNGLDTMARQALRGGVTIVSAAGNNNQPHELAEFDDVLAVAATDALDQLAGFSNRGPWVDLSAPGTNMAGPFLTHAGTDSIGARTPAYIDGVGGTSFAAPLVAAAAALVIADRRAAGLPPLTPSAMRLRLRETAENIAASNPAGGHGAGRLRLDRALLDPPVSTAIATGAATVGAPVVLRTDAGATRIVTAHMNNRLVMFGGQDGDTLWTAPLPGTPIAHVAAADLGGALGTGFFVGTSNGRIAGIGATGTPLPGWPVTIAGLLPQPVPALGDLDGDGRPEVVATTADQLFAFRTDGSPVPGFPVALFQNTRAPALANLDAEPGLEIAVVSDTALYVIDGDGVFVSGWPVLLPGFPTQPASLGRVRPFTLPTIVVAADTHLTAYAPNGTTRWLPRPLGGRAAAPLLLADLDGDFGDDIIAPLTTPALAAFDSLGAPMTARGWPRALPSAVSGHPVAGPLDGTTRNSVLVFRGGGLHAFNDSARALPGWPRFVARGTPPVLTGSAGATPSIAELDADGRTEVLAGTDSRFLLYVYDAGPGTWSGAPQRWFTARANFARTGSTVDAPGSPVIVDAVPSPVGDLAAAATSDTSVTLAWTAVGEDGLAGRPLRYEIRGATTPVTAQNFDTAPLQRTLAASVDAGGMESIALGPLATNTTWWFAVRAVDRAGQRAAVSNAASAALGRGGPLAGRDGIAIIALAQPSRVPVELHWQGPGGAPPGAQRIDLFDLQGRRIRTFHLGTEESGIVTWDGRTTFGDAVRAGMYFARLASGSVHAEARVVLIP